MTEIVAERAVLTGKHLIAGEWVGAEAEFSSDPAHGPAHRFAVGTPDLVDRAGYLAETPMQRL